MKPLAPSSVTASPAYASGGRDETAPRPVAGRSVADFVSPSSFSFPNYLHDSGWTEHCPFGFWIVEAHHPSTLVELGTHWGFSFFAFCQAVRALGLDTKCFAVDTWRGDAHAGPYGEEVFEAVRAHNDAHYSGFASLLRLTFDEAVQFFPDGSIDLLHIDGRHFYEDVRHDFDSWLSKLSRRGIVMLHDTNVLQDGFGVHRLWLELQEKYPSFEFLHGYGLGILATGEEADVSLRGLFEASRDQELSQQIRAAYARLGSGVELARANQNVVARVTALEEQLKRIKASASWRISQPLRLARDTVRAAATRAVNGVRRTQ